MTSRLGMRLADRLSEVLASDASVQIVPRHVLRELIQKDGLSLKNLADDAALRWLGRELGAEAVVTGTTVASTESLHLIVRVLSAEKGHEHRKSKQDTYSFRAAIPVADLSPVDPFSPNAQDELPADVFRAGVNGTSAPTCEYCPLPEYNDAARAAKFQGSATLDVAVSQDGRITDTRVVRGLPFGLTKQASANMQRWRLKPATRNGAPVATRVIVEVTFRLY